MESTHTDAYHALVERLVAARQSAGMRQADVAAACGRPQSFISKVENRERRLDVVEFLAIVRVIGVDPCDIIRSLPPVTLGKAKR